MGKCREKRVSWAILSDLYGVWFPHVDHEWYEKDPNTVTEQEFANLVSDFDQKLREYDEIWFYYNPGRFHPVYDRLLRRTRLRDRVRRFTHINEIVLGS